MGVKTSAERRSPRAARNEPRSCSGDGSSTSRTKRNSARWYGPGSSNLIGSFSVLSIVQFPHALPMLKASAAPTTGKIRNVAGMRPGQDIEWNGQAPAQRHGRIPQGGRLQSDTPFLKV